VTNSDLAFWGNLVYAGNYGGFRILDASADQPTTLVDKACNGPQNDVSVHEMGGRRFLFQSIDTPQTAEDCSSANAPIINGGRSATRASACSTSRTRASRSSWT
jgi:hypothetical protein